MPRQRDISLDVIRIIACLMVVLMHSPIPSDEAPGLFLSTISYLTAPCIGLFFMISGALLLPTTMSASQFLKKRLSKLIPPTLIWTLVYIILEHASGDTPTGKVWQELLSIPFSAQGHGVMWFMYTLIGFYLIIPIISPWLKSCSKNELIFYLCLCMLTFMYPFLDALSLDKSTTSIFYYFTGYGGYFLLGYFLKTYPKTIKSWWTVIGFIFALGLPVAVRLSHAQIDFYEMFWYLSFPTVLMCIFWYKITTAFVSHTGHHIGEKTKSVLSTLSNISFGIYLSHIAIMRYFIWDIPTIPNIGNYYIQTLIVFIITLTLSCVFSLIVSKTPLGKYIIGYSK